MLHLLKFLDDPWERAREFLRSDLEHIEAAINRRWSATFTDDNQLQPTTIPGDSTQDTRYIANTGPNHTPRWDQVNLSNGVTNRLPFNHLVAATQPSVLVGRESGTTGNFEELTTGAGLEVSGTTLRATTNERRRVIRGVVDGAGATPGTGFVGYVSAPGTGTIINARCLSDSPTGSIVWDVWKRAGAIPTVADTIVAAAPPTLSSANLSDDATLTGWTTSVVQGDVFAFSITSASGLTWATCEITILLS